MNDRINPSLLPLYDWVAEQNEQQVIVYFRIPEHLDYRDIEVLTNDNQTAIMVRLGDNLPFFAGTCYAEFPCYTESLSPGLFVLYMEKKEEEIWPIIIKAPIPQTYELDPKSSFLLGIDPKNQIQGEEFSPNLLRSLRAHYPSALLYAANKKLVNNDIRGCIEFFEFAVNEFRDKTAALQLGIIFSKSRKRINDAIKYLTIAAENGLKTANAYIARIYSPCFTDIEYENKDIEKAINYYKLAGEDDRTTKSDLPLLLEHKKNNLKSNLTENNKIEKKPGKSTQKETKIEEKRTAPENVEKADKIPEPIERSASIEDEPVQQTEESNHNNNNETKITIEKSIKIEQTVKVDKTITIEKTIEIETPEEPNKEQPKTDEETEDQTREIPAGKSDQN